MAVARTGLIGFAALEQIIFSELCDEDNATMRSVLRQIATRTHGLGA
jgi:hypothetical protein